jgi:SAM-dependent methyltransferase
MEQDIQKKFLEVFNSDKPKYIKDWLVSWDYQVKRKKRNVQYDSSLPSDFFAYNGPDDLVKWMNWFASEYTNYLPANLINPLIEKSLSNDKAALSKLGLTYDFGDHYTKRIGLNNAHDFLIPAMYPVPERYKVKNVLDFGAGYGRQANLWSENAENIYIGMDAIPNSYCLQHIYYSNLGRPFYEYISNPADFKISNEKKGIYHVPTWRYDLIPDNFIDMVMAVQVFQELSSKLVSKMLVEFHRVLKPGGMLYIRDHGETWKPAGKMNIDEFLLSHGYTLEFKPHIVLDGDLHGIPRIWRKNDPKVIDSQKPNFKTKVRQLLEDVDALAGGKLSKMRSKPKA